MILANIRKLDTVNCWLGYEDSKTLLLCLWNVCIIEQPCDTAESGKVLDTHTHDPAIQLLVVYSREISTHVHG